MLLYLNLDSRLTTEVYFQLTDAEQLIPNPHESTTALHFRPVTLHRQVSLDGTSRHAQ